MASFGLKVIRGVFAAAEHVAPRLTGRAAFELFCRTPNAKILSDGERRAVDRAAGFMAEARHHRLKTKNGCVMVHEFRPEPGRRAAGTVLVIHGWRSRTEYMRTLIEAYRGAGYKVVSLDLPGHGQSQGRRLTLVSAVEAALLAGEWFGPFVAVVGHSFGGAVGANAVVGSVKDVPPLAAERLVLIAAPSSLPAIFNDFSRMLSVGPRSQAAMADRVERIAGRPLHEFTGDRQLAGTPVPTLVIHAPDDREVSADHARLYAGAGDHVRLYWADGLGHRRILADKGVVERAVGFVAEHREPVSLH
ncbi:alpha/beta fold hydrolase [Mesorhizobium sp.]|uniref:alpha/beta hydrolase n=1 Tax=Mesorhizobium sp. TaxID=1871066 RepID=UPI000FE41996|nr:alpha/beta fold hydrolase [Mesorhizobium sp.]RWO02403.1 MAG: alpha/beta fold hydrolase [Mesorhizobium sp.]